MRIVVVLWLVLASALPLAAQQSGIDQDLELVRPPGEPPFIRWQAKPGRTYFIQVSTQAEPLRKWYFTPFIELGEGQSIDYEVPASAERGFFRLKYTDDTIPYGLLPEDVDFDGDGFTTAQELLQTHTDPLERDTDGDGLFDDWEIAHGLDPNDDGNTDPANGADGDPDGDGLTNWFEYLHGADPNLTDTDGDGLSDFDEVSIYYTDPRDIDTDDDGLDDYSEIVTHGTDPWDWDSDDDTLSDRDELLNFGTDPLEMDTDGDWMWDDWELANNLDPTDAADGLLDADSDTLLNQLEFVFRHEGYNPVFPNNAATFPWLGDPDHDGLTTDVEFHTYLTNPCQNDTDLDLLNDGWEVQYCFAAKVSSLKHGPANQRPDADPDGDGLTNEQESAYGTNPNSADTDGEDVNDKAEVDQGSNPLDPNDKVPPPEGTVALNIKFGDHSGSHSEKYMVKLEPLEGDNQLRIRTNREYGKIQTDTLRLPKGSRYRVTLEHVGTDPNYRDVPQPDFDYTLEIPQLAVTEQTLRIVMDPQGISGVHEESDSFFARGKSADLFVIKFETQTESQVPSNRERKKLGVFEHVWITVKPYSVGEIAWSLHEEKDAKILKDSGLLNRFTADTRANKTKLRATFDAGDAFDIEWDVVQPTGERATKTSDMTFPAGTQGVGMTLNIVTLPDDVSFCNVEVLEVDKGTSNVTGFFTSFAASALQHHPGPWQRLYPDNHCDDTASFSGWGSPDSWTSGTYHWDIEVRWRTMDEAGQGEFLANRTQLHTLHDSTARSTESKMGQTSTRTP